MLKSEDVANILGYANPTKAVITHVDAEDKLTSQIAMAGQRRNIIFINELGLYSLMLSGKDVASILGYNNTRDALIRHIDEEDKGGVKHDTLGGTQNLTIINESGLYSLILSGKDVESVMGELQMQARLFLIMLMMRTNSITNRYRA